MTIEKFEVGKLYKIPSTHRLNYVYAFPWTLDRGLPNTKQVDKFTAKILQDDIFMLVGLFDEDKEQRYLLVLYHERLLVIWWENTLATRLGVFEEVCAKKPL